MSIIVYKYLISTLKTYQMKSGIIILIFSLLLLIDISGQEIKANDESVEVIKIVNTIYHYDNIYLGGQPTLEELEGLRSKGISKIINLRTDEENRQFTESAYNEMDEAEDLGFVYSSVPVAPARDYSPEKLDEFIAQVNDNENIFVHCASGGRATYFLMAYLVKERGYSIDKAVDIGKQMRFDFPLERLLNVKISMKVMD